MQPAVNRKQNLYLSITVTTATYESHPPAEVHIWDVLCANVRVRGDPPRSLQACPLSFIEFKEKYECVCLCVCVWVVNASSSDWQSD